MKLSIIIPSYNNSQRLTSLLKEIKKIKVPKVEKEIIIVNDASLGTSYERIKKMKGIIYVYHKKNTGKGGALRTGFKKATGDILLIQDDDLEYSCDNIPVLLEPILNNSSDVVYGSRRLNKKNKYSSQTYFLGGVFINTLFRIILRRNLTDSITGAKVMTRRVYNKIKPIETNGFEIEAELTAKIVRAGFKVREVPIAYLPRSHKEGKNIRWHHAFKLITALWKYSR